MSQKDLAEKLLEDHADVFADIVNVLLFDGEEVVKESDLKESDTVSQYKADDSNLHEQERDIAKIWNDGNVHIALYGIENQTNVNKDMPLRIINYDGVAYRSQMLKESSQRFPVITLVLYYGEKRWRSAKSLHEALNIPAPLKQYINDYKIHLFEISYLSDRQLKMFKSDFGIIADFFVNKRRDKNYIPKDKRKFKHVDEMLKLLAVMTQDDRYNLKIPDSEKGETTMCTVLDRVENIGIQKGIQKGIQIGKQEGIQLGKQEGIQLGKQEGIKRGVRQGRAAESRKIAENMIMNNVPDDDIMFYCGISKKKLAQIRHDLMVKSPD